VTRAAARPRPSRTAATRARRPVSRNAARRRPDWEPPVPGRRHVLANWDEYIEMARRVVGRFTSDFALRYFDYVHPVKLQRGVPKRLQKPYAVRVAYTDWGDPSHPLIVCCGGVANSAMRFNYLASDLRDQFRVVSMDWLGRGLSGWMADERDYTLSTYVEQLRQLIEHLGRPAIVLGSSLGGSVAIELAARYPKLVDRLILNDIGPYIPRKRRKRRAETLARFYVFREPAELLRRVGASQKNDGPISDDIRFNITFHQTRWSDEDGGRIYRYDIRAMQAYRKDAQKSLVQWNHWAKLRCPILLVHGMMSDALLPETIARMQKTKDVTVMHVPDTGHTPVLSDRNQTWFIRAWLLDECEAQGEWSVMHATLRVADASQQPPHALPPPVAAKT
jgi:pimeloyl-ACP methyl ester carboxylesterase